MASSSSNPHVIVEIGEEYTYPYPSHVCAPNFVTFKLSGKDEYHMWKKQMVCLLKSHDMLGFIDGSLLRPQMSVSGKEKVGGHYTHSLWSRSDSLVQGWILGSLSKETLGCVLDHLTDQQTDADCSAMDVWDELQTMYGPAVLPQLPPAVADKQEQEEEEEEGRAQAHELLDKAIRLSNWESAAEVLRGKNVTVIDKITNNGNTALHVAVGTTQEPEFLQYLLDLIPANTQLSDVRNSDGSTPLHVAAIIGNSKAARILVGRNEELLLAKDNESHTPLALALSNMHTETSQFLLSLIITDIEVDTVFSGTSRDELLVTVISSKDFCLAVRLMKLYTRSKWDTDAVLMVVAQNFPCEHSIVEAYAGTDIMEYRAIQLHPWFCCSPWNASGEINPCFVFGYMIQMTYQGFINVRPFVKQRVQVHDNAMELLETVCRSIKYVNDPSSLTIKDPSGNNLLHLAARLAPTSKLNLISGAALQIQRELQWFKEVEGFVCPLSITQRNSYEETPQMIFTREHRGLVIEGEKWMKATAESYTITAALITTIVFAAAITVPGGNNQDTGIPLFTNNPAFTIFAISDAISLFSAVTSLLMFLSILTARFAEQDFLFKLPTKLIIGLATLFISTTTMIIAFGATLYLVFGQRNSRILIPIAMLTCLPITSFVTLQFPLIIDLMSATYGRRIFGKKYLAYSKDSLEKMKRPFY